MIPSGFRSARETHERHFSPIGEELISIYITGKRNRRNTAHTDGKDAGGE